MTRIQKKVVKGAVWTIFKLIVKINRVKFNKKNIENFIKLRQIIRKLLNF